MALTSCRAQRESLGQEQGKKASKEYSQTGGHGRNKSGHHNQVREQWENWVICVTNKQGQLEFFFQQDVNQVTQLQLTQIDGNATTHNLMAFSVPSSCLDSWILWWEYALIILVPLYIKLYHLTARLMLNSILSLWTAVSMRESTLSPSALAVFAMRSVHRRVDLCIPARH